MLIRLRPALAAVLLSALPAPAPAFAQFGGLGPGSFGVKEKSASPDRTGPQNVIGGPLAGTFWPKPQEGMSAYLVASPVGGYSASVYHWSRARWQYQGNPRRHKGPPQLVVDKKPPPPAVELRRPKGFHFEGPLPSGEGNQQKTPYFLKRPSSNEVQKAGSQNVMDGPFAGALWPKPQKKASGFVLALTPVYKERWLNPYSRQDVLLHFRCALYQWSRSHWRYRGVPQTVERKAMQ